jgi:hypothetical protein
MIRGLIIFRWKEMEGRRMGMGERRRDVRDFMVLLFGCDGACVVFFPCNESDSLQR